MIKNIDFMMRMIVIAIFVLACSLADGALGDTLEFMSGAKTEGKVLELTEAYVHFEVTMSGRQFARKYPIKKIHAVTYEGKRVVLNEKGGAKKQNGAAASINEQGEGDGLKDAADVLQLIEETGKTYPDWYENTSLEYPKTLKLNWEEPPKGSPWNQRVYMGQYVWSTINENPSRWKKGVKLLHHVHEINKGNPEAQKKAMAALGHCYADLLQDYARGAYWYQEALKVKARGVSLASLANCYWQLGCKELAVVILEKVPYDRGERYCSFVKLWSDMGELNRALKLAEATAERGNGSAAHLAAGDACRKHGQYERAIKHYKQVLAYKGKNKRQKNNLRMQQSLAQAAIDTINVYENLDLNRVKDGTYTGNAMSFAGMLDLEVTVHEGEITQVKVVRHKDKQFYSAMIDTPRQIIEKQGLKGVDAVTGATITSEAIINATAKALAKGAK